MATNYSQSLKKAHDIILKRVKANDEAQEQAKNIQKYFQLIKALANNNATHPVLENFNDSFKQEVKEAILKSNFPKNLFTLIHTQGKTAQTKKSDDIFELQLGIALRKLAQSQGVTGRISLAGTKSYNIDLPKYFQEETSSIIQEMVNQNKEIPLNNNIAYNKPVARSGKTDLNIGELIFSTQLSEGWEEFFTLLKNKSFSLKNYTKLEIDLGKSNIYKSFAGPLQDIGYSPHYIQGLFKYAAYNYNKDEEIQQHWYHLKYIYELTGAGLIGHKKVDFLVYNNPHGDIKVASTDYLIQQALESKRSKYRMPYREIVITANKL